MPFMDREDAGHRLAAVLAARFRGCDAVVYALPRGGVPVAAPIAAALDAPLDLVLVRKLGAPFQPEVAMGAIADGVKSVVTRNEDVIAAAGVSQAQFEQAYAREARELERRRAAYLSDRARCDPRGRVAIVVDDGVATGATMRAALRAVRAQEPARLVLATPVAAADTLDQLRVEADEIVCLEAHADFGAIGYFYRDFDQLDDATVIALLDAADRRRGCGNDAGRETKET
jgi:putative phosphoribosyl transferase